MNKLKGRSWAEIWFRAKQELAASSERLGVSSSSKLPGDSELFHLLDVKTLASSTNSPEGLLSDFRTREKPKFFAAFDDPAATTQELRNHFGTDHQDLISHANSIVEGQFLCFGINNLSYGNPIDWHLEPQSGKRSPLLHWSRISEIDSADTGDKKFVWELNRHQYFATLGRAYWLAADEKYAETFALHLSQWMDKNPPKLGVNWISSLEVAFRAISWLWALHFFRDSKHLTPELYARSLKYLYLHARHLETYLSTYSSPNTHLTGEALGLFYLGTILPQFRDAARWREVGRTILIDELSRQVLADGVYFERASYYHRYTTEFYFHFLILAERNGDAVSADVNAKVKSLLDHLMYITRPDGTTPFLGDDDGGQLAILDESEVNDFRPLLSTGAVLFDRADYKFVACQAAESTLWLLGPRARQTFEGLECNPPQSTSRAFPEGGIYVMRDNWTSEANYMLLDCGPHGVFNCGHAHADALSFELAASGRTMLVDSGTFTYTGSLEQRDYFRASSAHNALTVDGESSSVSDGPFSWKQIANSSILAWKSDERFDLFSGTHDGYLRLQPAPVKHTRSVLFLKNDYWVMRDCVETSGTHAYDLYFHFAPQTNPHFENSNGSVESEGDSADDLSGLQLFSFSDDGEWRREEGWVSSCYGAREPNSVFLYSAAGHGEKEFYSFLVPRRATDERVLIDEIEGRGGKAFEIRGATSRDILLAGSGQQVEAARIRSDFKWAWARFGADDVTLEELVLVDGHSFVLDGEALLTSEAIIGFAVARRHGDKLRLEVDNRTLEVGLPEADLIVAATFSNPTSDV